MFLAFVQWLAFLRFCVLASGCHVGADTCGFVYFRLQLVFVDRVWFRVAGRASRWLRGPVAARVGSGLACGSWFRLGPACMCDIGFLVSSWVLDRPGRVFVRGPVLGLRRFLSGFLSGASALSAVLKNRTLLFGFWAGSGWFFLKAFPAVFCSVSAFGVRFLWAGRGRDPVRVPLSGSGSVGGPNGPAGPVGFGLVFWLGPASWPRVVRVGARWLGSGFLSVLVPRRRFALFLGALPGLVLRCASWFGLVRPVARWPRFRASGWLFGFLDGRGPGRGSGRVRFCGGPGLVGAWLGRLALSWLECFSVLALSVGECLAYPGGVVAF